MPEFYAVSSPHANGVQYTHMPKRYGVFSFPQDETAHECGVEWWYLNGTLKGENGRAYSFMDCLFKVDPRKMRVPFFPKSPRGKIFFHHAITTDIKSGRSYHAIEFPVLVSEDSFKRPVFFVSHTKPSLLSGYVNCSFEAEGKSAYRLVDRYVDLKLESGKRPLLEGGKGLVKLGGGKKTYCYSLTDLKAEGRIKVGKRWIKAKGKAWMDHQWATERYARDKWSWFSVQLTNGTELVCFEYGYPGKEIRAVSIIDKNGRQQDFSDVKITPMGDKWVSPATKTAYPLAWRVQIREKRIDLRINAAARNQEMVFGPIKYWEGPTGVSGSVRGRAVRGVGFMELVGWNEGGEKEGFFERMLEKALM